MSFNQKQYISNFNKDKYKSYLIRVKKENMNIINKLESLTNKNEYINNLIEKDEAKEVLRFLKEEIARNASVAKSESSFTIDINSDVYLEYVYAYSENEDIYYNRLSLHSYCPMAKEMERIDKQYTQ
jgi:hypothetical protein